MSNVEQAFESELYETCDIAQRAGYRPKVFRQMLGSMGGVRAVRALLATGDAKAQTGLTRLYGLNLLSISVEAVVLKPEYRSLFRPGERAIARARLANYNFVPDWDTLPG